MLIGQEMREQAVVKAGICIQKMYGPRSRRMWEETVVKLTVHIKKYIVLLFWASQKTETAVWLLLCFAAKNHLNRTLSKRPNAHEPHEGLVQMMTLCKEETEVF